MVKLTSKSGVKKPFFGLKKSCECFLSKDSLTFLFGSTWSEEDITLLSLQWLLCHHVSCVNNNPRLRRLGKCREGALKTVAALDSILINTHCTTHVGFH